MKKTLWALFALLLLLPTIALAKGEFDYITVEGPGLSGELTITNPALTDDFFAFADFTKEAIEAPADPGEGYQIIRYYVVENKAQPFDSLSYFPYTGFVYYNGLAEGSSEYDKKWFAANPSANEPFHAALAARARLTWIPFIVLGVILVVFFFSYRKK
ncbi:MAG: hypothetical protein IT314_13780 [Anaerolineales bacterium]|nr:hypothetical protein [Anaerolineales bacterium]